MFEKGDKIIIIKTINENIYELNIKMFCWMCECDVFCNFMVSVNKIKIIDFQIYIIKKNCKTKSTSMFKKYYK